MSVLWEAGTTAGRGGEGALLTTIAVQHVLQGVPAGLLDEAQALLELITPNCEELIDAHAERDGVVVDRERLLNASKNQGQDRLLTALKRGREPKQQVAVAEGLPVGRVRAKVDVGRVLPGAENLCFCPEPIRDESAVEGRVRGVEGRRGRQCLCGKRRTRDVSLPRNTN